MESTFLDKSAVLGLIKKKDIKIVENFIENVSDLLIWMFLPLPIESPCKESQVICSFF